VTTNEGSSYLLGIEREASNTDGGQKLSGYYCKSPLRNDITNLVTCAISAIGGQSMGTFVACLTMRRSFHLFIDSRETLIVSESMATSSDLQTRLKHQSSNVMRDRDAKGSGELSIDEMIHCLAALDGAIDRSGDSKDFSKNTAEATRSAFQLVSSLNSIDRDTSSIDIEIQDKNTLLVSCKESSAGDEELSSHSSLLQSETTHIFQPSQCVTLENHCRVLAKRSNESDDECEPMDVFYGGLAQSNSVMVGASNKWNAQVWNQDKLVTFKSTTISFVNDDGNECNRNTRQDSPKKRKMNNDSTGLIPLKSPGYYGFSFQRKKSSGAFFPFFHILEKMPTNKGLGNGDLISALKAYRKSGRMLYSSDELEYLVVKAANEGNAKAGTFSSHQAFSSLKMAIPQSAKEVLFADTAQYIGPIPGMRGTFAAIVDKEDTRNEGDELAMIEIGCCANDQRVVNASINAIHASLKEFFFHATKGCEMSRPFMEHISKALSEPSTKHVVKVLKRVCSRLANEDADIETYIEVYKKLRSLPLSRAKF